MVRFPDFWGVKLKRTRQHEQPSPKYPCPECGTTITPNDMRCPNCFGRGIVKCIECEEEIPINKAIYDAGYYLCKECYEDEYDEDEY